VAAAVARAALNVECEYGARVSLRLSLGID
jgi:hypothetical protein